MRKDINYLKPIHVISNIEFRRDKKVKVPSHPNTSHSWYFDLEHYFDYEYIAIWCSACGAMLLYNYHIKNDKLIFIPASVLFVSKTLINCSDMCNLINMEDALS